MSSKRRDRLYDEAKGAVAKYYYDCPRCESTSVAWIGRSDLGYFGIHKWVCQECCHVFELMDPEDVREKTGWVD